MEKRWFFNVLTMLVILSEAQKCQIVIQKIYLDDKKCISRLKEPFIIHFHAYLGVSSSLTYSNFEGSNS